MAKNIFNSAIFKGPKYSFFPMDHSNRVSMNFGDIVPIYWDVLMNGDKASFDMTQVVRLSPMLAPVMDQIDITVDAFAVRLRSLGMASRDPWTYEDFFNPQKNMDGSEVLPSAYIPKAGEAVKFAHNTLWDYMNLPTLDRLRDELRRELVYNFPWLFSTSADWRVSGSGQYWHVRVGAYGQIDGDGRFTWPYFEYAGESYYKSSQTSSVLSLIQYVLDKYRLFGTGYNFKGSSASLVFERYGTFSTQSDAQAFVDSVKDKDIAEVVYQSFGVDWVSVVSDYLQYLFEYFLGSSQDGDDSTAYSLVERMLTSPQLAAPGNGVADHDMISRMPLYPFASYWKIIADWYINTALLNPEDFFLDKYDASSPDLGTLCGAPYKRNWKNDYFTSCFDNPQAGQAVGIPVNGTIPDLRNANSLQKFRERLLYAGQKARDVWYAIWGIKTSSAIMDMSEPLGRWVNPVNIDSVLQQSESTAQSPQAQYAGTGLSYGNKNGMLHYTAEEPTVIMFLASITPKYASYFQGIPRKFMRSSLFDYAIPGFENVGEQPVYSRELYADAGAENTSPTLVFGWNRRYADWMFAPDEVHGDFRSSYDYWHLARQFDGVPSLSETFLQVRGEEDNLNRIFAVTSDSVNKFYCHFRFHGGIVRSLPRHIHYDL